MRHTRLSSPRIALPELAPLRRDKRRRLPRLHRAGPSTSLDKSAVFDCQKCTRVLRVTHTIPCRGGARQLASGGRRGPTSDSRLLLYPVLIPQPVVALSEALDEVAAQSHGAAQIGMAQGGLG